jgi:hypothetical protein
MEIVMVTPEMAGDWLLRMEKQRKESSERSDRYALDMGGHDWLFTGDPMRFDSDGAFVDGQHRAKAIVKSGLAQPILIIWGLHPGVMKVLDIGFKRTFTNLLQMAEVPNPSYVAAITKAHFHWVNGLYGERNVARVSPNPERYGIDPTHTELWSHFGRFPQLIASAQAAQRMAPKLTRSRMVSRTTLGLVWMVLGQIDPYKRDEFLGQVTGDVELTNTSPGYPPMILGDRLNRRYSGVNSDRVPQWAAIGLMFRAWNGWVRGEDLKTLRVPHSPQARLLAKPIDPNAWTPGDTKEEGDE